MLKHFGKKLAAVLMACAAIALTACGGGGGAEPAQAKPLDRDALVEKISAMEDGSGNPLFTDLRQPDGQELSDVYNIDVSLFQDYLILVDQNYNFCMMMIPADGKSNDVKNMMSTAMTQLAQQLELYLPEQCQRVRERQETMRGDYLIYTASGDNEGLLAEIESAMA